MLHPHRRPIDELILTVLSQNTNDRNRDVAYGRMRERFPSWDEVREAPVDELEDALRPGGLAPTKAVRIQQILRRPRRRRSLLARGRPARGGARLSVLAAGRGPQDGRLRAAVLLRPPEVPVDTHVFRVGTRLGLFAPRASVDAAHDEMLRLVDPDDAYEVHVLLIRHGRRTCTARAPACAECPLRRMCPEGRRRLAGG